MPTHTIRQANRRRILTAGAASLGGSLLTACGGGGGGDAPVDGPIAQACTADGPYAGARLHAAWPAASLPVGTPPDAALPPELATLLDARVVTLLTQTNAPAIAAALGLPGIGRWTTTLGLARVASALTAGTTTTLFYWASVAKSLTAALVLQLVDEGHLTLNDRLARWFPQMPQAGLITVEQLLTHTSGMATNARDAQGLTARAALLQAAATTPSPLCPGTGASYSNTGYWLLGLIVEAVDQRPFHEVLQRRIAEPLGLQRLRALRPGEDSPEGVASPHSGRVPQTDPGAWLRLGAGNVVASAEDMLRYWQALLGGHLLPAAALRRQWARLYPLQDDSASQPGQALMWAGQGVMLMEWADNLNRRRSWQGHLGGIPTANATLAYDPLVDAHVAVAVNSEVSSAAVANALLQVVTDWRAANG